MSRASLASSSHHTYVCLPLIGHLWQCNEGRIESRPRGCVSARYTAKESRLFAPNPNTSQLRTAGTYDRVAHLRRKGSSDE
jgi:hypothetical protein